MNACTVGAFEPPGADGALCARSALTKGTSMTTKSLLLALALLGASGMIVGCEPKTPLQKAGDDLKDAAHDTGDAIKDAGRDAKDAAKDAGNDLKKATDGKPN